MQSNVDNLEQPSSGSTATSAAATSKRSSKRNRKSRGKGLRVRTGCHCCRARHLKCDEGRPACKACEKSSRLCSYPSTAATTPLPDETADEIQLNRPENASHGHSTNAHDFVVADGLSQTHGEALYVENSHRPLASNAEAFDFSPGSTWSDWANISAESATLGWFDLVATDAAYNASALPDNFSDKYPIQPLQTPANIAASSFITGVVPDDNSTQDLQYVSNDDVILSSEEARLLQHYVCHLSAWIDITDPDRSFAIVVPQLALRNRGLMNALLALSARHLLLDAASDSNGDPPHQDRASALEYYHNTLHWLQNEMRNPLFLRSDELLATALLISTYEMIDGSGRGWERHLKGVFWIQRSQLIHGESEGLKQRIWWAWLRQDLWAAFKERRKILSYYHLTKTCADLDFWELVNRAVWLLGQCVNYASLKEEEAGRSDLQARVGASTLLWEKLEEWGVVFAKFDRRLPAMASSTCGFEPIWINPPAAALALQVHHVSRLLLIEYTPATSGLKELLIRQSHLQSSVRTVCGIACCIYDEGLALVSEQCVYAAGMHAHEETQKSHVLELLRLHRNRTRWPQYDLGEELKARWSNDAAERCL